MESALLPTTPVAALLFLLLCCCAAPAGAEKRWGEPSTSTCVRRRHAEVGAFCGLRDDGLHVCDPTASYCESNSTRVSVPTCVPLVAIGGSCTAPQQCYRHWENAHCLNGRCHLLWHRQGESCNAGDGTEECFSFACKSGICADHDYRAVGAACSMDGLRDVCTPGLVCANKVCAVPKDNGTMCSHDYECRGKCSNRTGCIDPYVQPVGAPCLSNDHCALGLCSMSADGFGVCMEPPPEMHIPCKSNEDCMVDGGSDKYSCECDVKNKGWFCKRRWSMPDYTVGKCVLASGWGACEDLYIRTTMETVRKQALYMWSSAPRAAISVAATVALVLVL
eukprot:m51a1_g13056 hypothetical protein (335) ;mRNA; r:1179-2324